MCLTHVGDRQQSCDSLVFDARFYTQNARGLNEKMKRKKVFNNFKDKADVIFVQESHSTSEKAGEWDADWEGNILYSHGTSASRGCMIMFKSSLDHLVTAHVADEHGRYILAKCEIRNQKMFLINVYAPNKEKEHEAFLLDLFNSIKAFYDDEYYHVVAGGDWNFVENVSLDKKGGQNRVWEKSVNQLAKLKELFDLVDIWRVRNEDKKQYTWHSNSTPRVFTRLDRFYISDNLQSSIFNASITPGLCSDHSAVGFHLKCNSTILGAGLWKLNTQHLKDLDFVKKGNDALLRSLTLIQMNLLINEPNGIF